MYLSPGDAPALPSLVGGVGQLGRWAELELNTDKKYGQLHAVNGTVKEPV